MHDPGVRLALGKHNSGSKIDAMAAIDLGKLAGVGLGLSD
jgi:hypothetical protein